MNVSDLVFVDSEDRPVPVSAFRGQKLLLVFTRHVACTACRSHLAEVATLANFLSERGVAVLAVTFTPPKLLKQFLAEFPQPFPMASDPNRDAYRRLGMVRASPWSFFRPAVIGKYLKQMFAGFRVKKPLDKDVFQLGGDFLIDTEGNVVWTWISRHAQDRPTTDQLRAAVTAQESR